jgi:DNA-binding NarL/FixJ family response regulator
VGPFDCAIVDIELGSADGIALAQRLMRAGKVRRVVFYTGSTDCGALRRASELGPVVLKDELLAELTLALAGQVASPPRCREGS